MIEFKLAIDLGKKERVDASAQSMPIDRDFVGLSLAAVGDEIRDGGEGRGVIYDATGLEVGRWEFSSQKRAG